MKICLLGLFVVLTPLFAWAQPPLPNWVGSAPAFNWQPRLGGVYWLNSRAVVKQAAPYLTNFSRSVLVDIKSDGAGFGYRFDTNSWDSQEQVYSWFTWDGTDAGTPTSPEDALQIFGATSNAQFILNIPIPLNLTNSPYNDPNGSTNFGYDGWGYTWQTPAFYAAMVQYLFGAAGPTNEWQGLATNLDFFSEPTNFNWADLRAVRGHVGPYPVVAVIIGEEPYNVEGEKTGSLYGQQAEKFRIAIRNRGYTGPLGLHVPAYGFPDDTNDPNWFWPMMTNLTASDFSYVDLHHYYQFSSVPEDFKRAYPISINTNAAYWLNTNLWKSDYTKFLWIVEDTRNAIRDDNTVPGLGDPGRWNLGWSEHGIQVSTGFNTYNDMFSAMHWAGWLAEAMRQNVAWDSGWVFLGEGFSTAQLQIRSGYATRTPMFFVYQMAQEFVGYDYLTNSYSSPVGWTTDGTAYVDGNPANGFVSYSYPWTTIRVFRDPATGNIHLFVVNQSTNSTATITGFETNWTVIKWEQLVSTSYTNGNPLGVPGPEPIQTTNVPPPPSGSSLVIPPISVNHITLSASNANPDIVWVEDTVPGGAWTTGNGGDSNSWIWVSNNPVPFSGLLAHQSTLQTNEHDHGFAGATNTLTIHTGDKLVTYVNLDVNHPPQEIMLSWFDGTSWNHSAYWGADLLPYGVDGTASQTNMGARPLAGQWIRLEVPASTVGLEGSTLSGMDFILSDGKATWDHSGKAAQ